MHLFSRGPRLALLVPTLVAAFAFAQPYVAIAQAQSMVADGTGVARISVISGNVAVQRGDSSESLAAALNAPILGGDYITTGDAARTEIQFDGTAQLRLGPDAQLRFTQIDRANRTVQLAQGTLELRLLQGTDGSSEIDTPSISIKPLARGAYRVSVTSDGQTRVTVRSGQAEIDTPQGVQNLQPGSTVIAQGSADNPAIQTVAAIAPDDFDAFNTERDRLRQRALADASFVNTNIDGIEDLDVGGRWVTDGSYGHVWVPAAVGPDWAPYRNGRWVWEDGYGWTWVAAEPWGWAPYHYGSWYHSPDYGWCWYPPQPRVFTPWRPALVAFFGFGIGTGLALGFGDGPGFGNIGWVPLAPFEIYHPWWGSQYGFNGSPTIVNNITNVTTVNTINIYHNVRYNGVSGVTSQRFLQGNFAHNNALDANDLRHAQVFRNALPIVPTASNLRFTEAARTPVNVNSALLAHSFAGNSNVVHRMAFTDQRSTLAAVTHAPITPLHFRDAGLTPVVLQHHTAAVPISGAGDAHASTAPIAAPRYLESHSAAATDPWARFNHSRAIDSPGHPVVPPTGVKNPALNRAPDSRPSIIEPAHAAAPRATDYHLTATKPAFTQTYHEPATTQPNHKPATTQTIHEPIGNQTHHEPANLQTHHEPATLQTNHEPATIETNHEPATTQTYHNPAATQTNHEPAGSQTYGSARHDPPPRSVSPGSVTGSGSADRYGPDRTYGNGSTAPRAPHVNGLPTQPADKHVTPESVKNDAARTTQDTHVRPPEHQRR